MIRNINATLALIFVAGSLIWFLFHGVWEAAFIGQTEQGHHRFLIDLGPSPVWDAPEAPTQEVFSARFETSATQFPDHGRIEVYHKCSWWLMDLFAIWLVGALVLAPIALFFYRKDKLLGVLGRVAAALLGGAAICFALWLVVGGWGPPLPGLFAALGLGFGVVWSLVFLSADSNGSEQTGRGNE